MSSKKGTNRHVFQANYCLLIILINAYRSIDDGERDTIRLGITMPEFRIVIDDQTRVFFVAARFEMRPIILLENLVVDSGEYLGRLAKELASCDN